MRNAEVFHLARTGTEQHALANTCIYAQHHLADVPYSAHGSHWPLGSLSQMPFTALFNFASPGERTTFAWLTTRAPIALDVSSAA